MDEQRPDDYDLYIIEEGTAILTTSDAKRKTPQPVSVSENENKQPGDYYTRSCKNTL